MKCKMLSMLYSRMKIPWLTSFLYLSSLDSISWGWAEPVQGNFVGTGYIFRSDTCTKNSDTGTVIPGREFLFLSIPSYPWINVRDRLSLSQWNAEEKNSLALIHRNKVDRCLARYCPRPKRSAWPFFSSFFFDFPNWAMKMGTDNFPRNYV